MTALSRILGRFLPIPGKRQIEAGGGGRRWEGASLLPAPQQSTLAARHLTKARAAAASINTPWGARIVETWVSNLAGKGWNVRPKHPDTAKRAELAEAFEALTRPILIPAVRGIVRDGEAFVHLLIIDGQLRLKLIAPDQVDPSLTRDLGNGHRIIAGIELDATDTPLAYHVLPEPPGSSFAPMGQTIRVPASDMLHIFDRLFPGQVRGLSWLAPVLLRLRDRDEASDALLMQLKVAALITGFVKDTEGGSAGLEGESAGGALNVALEPGAMRILPPGADVTFSQPGQGLSQSVEFLKGQDREIAAGAGLTFEQLTGDHGEANYSSARVGLLEFRRRAEMLQQNLIEAQLLRPLWKRWIGVRVLAGEIPQAEMADFLPVRFVPPGWAWVDPRNEVEADVAAIGAGLKSREEVVAGRGRDIDELDDELARDTLRQPKKGTENDDPSAGN